MIFEYDELKKCIGEEFEWFNEKGFNEKQIFLAVLNEYKHGEDFCLVEKICIHMFLILNYIENDLNYSEIAAKLNQLVNEKIEDEMKVGLGSKYSKVIMDLNVVGRNYVILI